MLVKNLPSKTSAAELSELFKKHGEVNRIILPPSGITGMYKHFAVIFASAEFRHYSKLLIAITIFFQLVFNTSAYCQLPTHQALLPCMWEKLYVSQHCLLCVTIDNLTLLSHFFLLNIQFSHNLCYNNDNM